MNKRIQKLFNEAGFHQPEMERLGIEGKFEKFALLIVGECVLISRTSTDGFSAGRRMEEYFGVEE